MRKWPSPRALLLISLSLSLLLSAAGTAGAAAAGESERLRRCFDLAWESKLRETPEFLELLASTTHALRAVLPGRPFPAP